MVPGPAARRLLHPPLIALVLAIGTVSGAVVQDSTNPAPVAGPAVVAAVPAPTGAVLAADSREVAAQRPPTDAVPIDPPAVLIGAPGERPTPPLPATRPAIEPKGTRASTIATDGDRRGRNHVWMPALGIDRSVSGYACSNKSYPGNRVYRWGCAGANNIYLFGHASSVFKPLHDAYVRGKLKKGQELWYADSSGTVRRYTVAWWKVTTPTKGTWAYAAQSSPSVTLQTCVGKDNQYRLIVRLARAD